MPADPTTNYAGHDRLYVTRRTGGLPGWGSPEDARENARRAQDVLGRHPRLKQTRLLEIGCGNGQMTAVLARQGYAMEGIDISPAAVEWACELAERENLRVTYRVGSVLRLPYPDRAFDAVVDGNCLHCIIGRDRAVVLSEVHRVLAPGGVFAVQTMCGDPPAALRDAFNPETRCLMHPDGFASRFLGDAETILKELADAGFHVTRHHVEEVGVVDARQQMLVVEAIRRDPTP